MARSQLLKDLTSGNSNIESILMRLKVILIGLNNDVISEWVEGELSGYRDISHLPPYRVVSGEPKGHCIINNRAEVKNYIVPLRSLLIKRNILDKYEDFVNIDITDGIGSLEYAIKHERERNFGRSIPTEVCQSLSSRELQIASMNILIPINKVEGVILVTKSKLIDVILKLEKDFTDIDSLDIENQFESKESTERDIIIINLLQIINDNSIEIGDGNKITKSQIGHSEVEKYEE